MGGYIERSAARASILHEDPALVYAIDRIPDADAQPVVHGEWIADPYDPEYMTVDFHCSRCGLVLEEFYIEGDCWPGKTSHYYCSNCGADMRPSPSNGEDMP